MSEAEIKKNGINWQRDLNQNSVRQMGVKQGLSVL